MKENIRYRLLAIGEIVEYGDEEFVAAAGWCPVEDLHRVGQEVQDDEMPVRRAFARRLRAADQQAMDLGKALEIVWEMAKSLYHQHGEFCKPAKCPADVTAAMDTVEDFIVNHFEEDDEAQNQTRQERLSVLFDAMERHGNAEGTETQLGDAEEFLLLAFGSMSPTQQTEFLDSSEVTEFVAREGSEEGEDE